MDAGFIWTKESIKKAESPSNETDARKWKKGSIGLVAVGAKPRGTKGNKQEAKYKMLDDRHEKLGRR